MARAEEGTGQAEQDAGPEFAHLSGAREEWRGEGGHSSTATLQVTLSPDFSGTSVLRQEEGPALPMHAQPCAETLRRAGRDAACPRTPAPPRRGTALSAAQALAAIPDIKKNRRNKGSST